MSEDLDLEANNLCIPEDAFEKFQAVSMYQEEEYITLPQKVPLKPKPPAPDESCPVSNVNEVVSSSGNVTISRVNSTEIETLEEKQLNSSCVESSIGLEETSNVIGTDGNKQLNRKNINNYENYTDMVVSNSENVNDQPITTAVSPTPITSVVPRKRGRKPKKPLVPMEELSIETPKNIQNPDISSTPFSSDPETSDMVPVGRTKRGRPRKALPNDTSNMVAINSDKDLSSELSNSDNNKTVELSDSVKKPSKGKRGRPKGSGRKIPAHVNLELQTQPPILENKINYALKEAEAIHNQQLNSSSNETSKIHKRRIESLSENIEKTVSDEYIAQPDSNNKLLSDSFTDEDQDDDVCLSKLKSTPCQSNMSVSADENCPTDNKPDDSLKNINSENIDGQLNKAKKRRGRPKKEKTLESLSQMIENSLTVTHSIPINDITLVEDSDADDMCLSKLKEINEEPPKNEEGNDKTEIPATPNKISEQAAESSTSETNGTPTKRNTKMPVMADFEYNIDSVIGNDNTDVNSQDVDNSLLVEDTSKRPIRRKIKTLKYDEESDEDPFANVELSDDEPRRGRRGNKYYSDDEYIPGKRGNDAIDSTDTEVSDGKEMKSDDTKRHKRKKFRKRSDNQSPRKKGKKDEETNPPDESIHKTDQTDDIEICLEPSVIRASDGDSQQSLSSQKWGTTTEFENFLAKKIQGTNLKIKKVSSNLPVETTKMEIPVIDPEAKKTIEMCSQTTAVPTASVSVQTSTPNDLPLKENIPLTTEQSEKACYFLNSIVKTTAELGSLMTQKSEDFIKKKINTSHVTDTAKMDYCVKKSFLLFKLAKHNLLQMEEDLATQYDEFLKTHNLTRCREEPKAVLPTPKESNSDSDCEIVDVKPSPNIKPAQKPQAKPAFNPKTVFLNKELSIKIAKKPSENKKLDIKGRHTVWINDTVMVKKVKPTQSFLAQDSRNKKPPDNCITTEMVSHFFKDYYRQKALSACAPFVSTNWLNMSKDCVCNYFVVKPLQFQTDTNYSDNNGFSISSHASNTTVSAPGHSLNDVMTLAKNTVVSSPEPLFTLCFRIIKRHLHHDDFKESTHKKRHEIADWKSIPVTLFRLCMRTIIDCTTSKMEICPSPVKHASSSSDIQVTPAPLKSLCHRRIVDLLEDSTYNNTRGEKESYIDKNCYSEESSDSQLSNSQEIVLATENNKNSMKSLFSLCVEYIQQTQQIVERNNNSILSPKTLKTIAYENVKYLLYANDLYESHQDDGETAIEGLMINCVNTLSEEAFLNLEQCNTEMPDSSEYIDDFDNEDNFEQDATCTEEEQTEPSWVTQVQMQELRSCVNINSLDANGQHELEPIITQIKLEPLDDITDNFIDSTQVKIEPGPGPDEMTIIPDVKPEIEEHLHAAPIQRQSSNSYDGEAFETFVNCNKLMRALTDQDTEEIYSQSSERIRRQHEPDYYEENAADMLGLLVPHTYQTMNIQTAKGILMESSSDESNKKVSNTAKKATAKRSRGRPRKAEQKPNNKEIPVPAHPVLTKEKEKTTSNEVAILTRKMKERIRQEEKKNESSDSESENITVRLRSREKKDTIDFAKDKSKLASKETLDQVKSKPSSKETLDQVKSKPSSKETLDQAKDKLKPGAKETNANTPEKSKPVPKETPYLTRDKSKIAIKETIEQIPEKSKPTSSSKAKNIEIQCNNVDSTDQLEDSVESFTGFTSIETNEMSNYEKYMKFVYEKVIPDKEEDYANFKKEVKGKVTDKDNKTKVDKSNKPLICPNEPVELLECEPTMPIFDDKINNEAPPKKNEIKATISEEVPPFIDRHGWECYPIDVTDFKLCQNACIYLEKLPESFVQTYFQYQNIAASIDKSDEEINRLTNLNTLNRTTILKDRKPQNCCKRDPKDDKPGSNLEDDSRTVSAVESDHYQELLPSDDDTPNVEDEVAQPMQRQTDNTLAKNCLMDDKESDDEALVKVKSEPVEGSCDTKKIKPSPKKKVVDPEDSGDLMLTADKMMNKELTLLHAPVVMDEQVKETPTKGPVTRHNKKSGTKTSPTNNKVKTEEDSSSEEEKQWVSTKEKLLKRMGKKESASADDAKRAKLVSEFIERREGNPDGRKRRSGARPRRSGKRFLEREKQLRVLQRELFGEMSNDPTVTKRSVAAWKGRRNIRKVLDKKSLARSTVIANMEEFERKRRLNARQTKLRELLGCEEGVNVLVINDEVCLEYDFEEHRPVVTIHPFFTKVMKAHQYEGVKFMWDACFESLADLEARRAGGGCILAHCMGLGKTLQVLALLHTVLTHPRVGMHRVLVCCPLSTVLNWVDEIHKWIGPVTNQIKVFELSKLKKTYERAYQLEDWYNGGGIFIIGYELFRSLSTLDPLLDDVRPTIVNKIRTALLDPGPDIIVCDEGHLLKNDCSVLAVAMSRVVTKRRIILTGTPMQNNLREYYCMVNFVKPNLLGTYSEYSNRFENPIMNGQHRDSSEEDIKLMKARTHILHKVLEGCLQRQEVSVLYPYLPKKHEYTVFITLTKCQWDLYKHYLNHYSKQMKQNSILKDFHILQKIWSHPQVLHNFQTKSQETRNKIKLEKLEDDLATEEQEDIKDVATELWWLPYLDDGNMLDSLESSNKFVVVFRILDECVALGDKVLIFSTSLFCLDALEYFLKKINKWSLGQEYYRLDGSVPAEVRQKWCREFNAENNLNTKLFLVSTRAGCLGLNMTGANRVIIMDTSWNPAHDIQSIFRVYRFGQKKDCYIYRLVAMGTMEQKIYERSVTKQAVACRVVDEQQIDRHYNMAELTELYRYDEAGASVAGGVAVGVCDVALLRVARETALHAVHEHDSLLRSSEQGLPEHERAAAWMQFQQEQAHKQMENKLIANIPKLSLKRVQGNAYTKSLHLEDIKTEIKIEDASNDFLPLQEAKAKKGKKPSRKIVIEIPPKAGSSKDQTAEHYNPEAPGTSKEPKESLNDKQYEDEIMVHKITELLIKHDFQNRKANTEIANLVTNVRRIVKQGYIYKHDKPDDLTTSIAKVLLQKRMSLPVLTDIMCESINKTVSPDNSQEPENILSTPNPTNESTVRQNAPDNRRKRKAALAAEKHIDSISQDVIISLDEDMDPSDTDFVPKIVEKSEKTNSKRKSILRETLCQKTDKDTVKTLQRTTTTDNNIDKPNNSPVQDIIVSGVKESVSKSDSVPKSKPANAKPKAGPKTFKEKLKKKKIIVNIETPAAEGSSSILLSDDEDEDKTSSAGGTTAAPAADDDEVVPLPLSLLTNKNFINIVAHTYLNGNPMLDADAATLAAQYSTFKSLKEAEQTGKDIVSGPIYDIALKVIGKTLFKRMNSNNIKSSNTTAETANVSIELKERMDKATDKKCKEEAKPKKKKQEKVDTPGKRDCNMIESSTNACPNGNVVPVGLIKTAGSLPSQDFAESILPDDDDDMHIVPHDYPPSRRGITPAIPARPSQPSPTPQHSTMQVSQTKESLPKQNKGVDSKPSTSTATKPPTKKVNKAIRGKIIHPTSVVSGNSSQAKQPPTQHILSANDTICLDSDEEETITPTPLPTVTPARQSSPAPVPVSLTLGPPLEDVSPGPATTKPMTSAQGLPAKSLVLRQVVAGSGSKFVLVPALPSTVQKPPKLIPKEPVRTQSTPLKAVPAESILSTTNSSSLCLKKIKQARCKPGDIIKISDNGEIEVLQVAHLKPTAKQAVSEVAIPKLSNEIPKSKPPSEVTNSKPIFEVEKPKSGNSEVTKSKSFIDLSKPIPSISDVTKPKPVVNKPAVNKPAVYKPAVSKPAVNKPGVSQPSVNKPAGEPSVTKPAENRTPKPRTVSISSSSSEGSRPGSPDNNPLSILKNVVQIQAADETTGKSSDNAKSKQKASNCSYTEHVNLTESKDSSKGVAAKKLTKESLLKTTKEVVKTIKEQPKSKDVGITSSISSTSMKTDTSNKLLTDLLNKKTTLSMKPTLLEKKPVLPGGLKAIVIDKNTVSSSNKTFKTVDLTQTMSVKSGCGASMLKTKIEAKKRVSSTETSTPKKKKTEPMTLKDFNLDDIDDIIELD